MRNCWFMALNAFVQTCFLSAFQKSLLFFVNLNLKKVTLTHFLPSKRSIKNPIVGQEWTIDKQHKLTPFRNRFVPCFTVCLWNKPGIKWEWSEGVEASTDRCGHSDMRQGGGRPHPSERVESVNVWREREAVRPPRMHSPGG